MEYIAAKSLLWILFTCHHRGSYSNQCKDFDHKLAWGIFACETIPAHYICYSFSLPSSKRTSRTTFILSRTSEMSLFQDNMQTASKVYSSSFAQSQLVLAPAKKILLVTCHDTRIDPLRVFGFKLGDAHIIRNVRFTTFDNLNDPCKTNLIQTLSSISSATMWRDWADNLKARGSARDALRGVITSQQMMGTWEIISVEYINCGIIKSKAKNIYNICYEYS